MSGQLIYELPEPGCQRWTPLKKAMIIRAVHDGRLTLGEMCVSYGISLPEFHEWEVALVARGVDGLRVTERPRRRSGRYGSGVGMILAGIT